MFGRYKSPLTKAVEEYEEAKYGKHSLMDAVVQGDSYAPTPPKSPEEIDAAAQRLRAALPPGMDAPPAPEPLRKLAFKKRKRPERTPLKAPLGECVEWLRLHYGPDEGVKRVMKLTGRSRNVVYEWLGEVPEDRKTDLDARYNSLDYQEFYDEMYGEQALLTIFAHWENKSFEQVCSAAKARQLEIEFPLSTASRRPLRQRR